MSDIVSRLRRWSIATDAVPASDIMDEAADEIERLRLTDAEREAVDLAIDWLNGVEDVSAGASSSAAAAAATLRGLLERTKGDQ